jgi:hypothetical protein
VVLDAEGLRVWDRQSFHGLVVQVQVRHDGLASYAGVVHREAMVLRGDFHATRDQVLDRLIRASVAELHLVRLAAQRQGEKLVAQTDAKYGYLPQQRGNGFLRAHDSGGVTRTIGQKDAIRLSRQDLGGGGSRGNDVHLQPTSTKNCSMDRLSP